MLATVRLLRCRSVALLRSVLILTPDLVNTAMGGLLEGMNLNISSPPLYHLTLYTCSPCVSYSQPSSTDWPPRPNGGTWTCVSDSPRTLGVMETMTKISSDLINMLRLSEEEWQSHNIMRPEPESERGRLWLSDTLVTTPSYTNAAD